VPGALSSGLLDREIEFGRANGLYVWVAVLSRRLSPSGCVVLCFNEEEDSLWGRWRRSNLGQVEEEEDSVWLATDKWLQAPRSEGFKVGLEPEALLLSMK
jgi:hypothetical protein